MYRSTEKNKELVISILTNSFKENKSITYVVKNDIKQEWRIQKLMEYSFNIGMSCGEVFISNDNKACAILLYSHIKMPILKRIKYDLSLVINCIGVTRILPVLKVKNK